MSLIKSKTSIADHGEMFTPLWMVEAMLDLVKGETDRIDSRFLAGCGKRAGLSEFLLGAPISSDRRTINQW